MVVDCIECGADKSSQKFMIRTAPLPPLEKEAPFAGDVENLFIH